MNLFGYLVRQQRFSRVAFPNATWRSALHHLEDELLEVREDPENPSEWADVVILALDGAMRAGHTPHDMCRALEAKLALNMSRNWGEPDERGVVCHVRDLEAKSPEGRP